MDEREVRALTDDLQDMHHETLPSMRESLRRVARLRPGRRPVGWRSWCPHRPADACSCSAAARSSVASRWQEAAPPDWQPRPRVRGSSGVLARSMAASSSGQKLTGDLAVVGLAAALENLAVGTYQAGIDAATAGTLGAVPPAVVEFAMTAQRQHQDHADAWNGVLTGAGKKAVTGVDLTVKKSVDKAFGQVTDVGGLAKLALDLENVASATYLAAIDGVKSKPGIKTAATIQPVELQHAAILLFVLGEYPVPDAFAKQTGARSPSDKIGAAVVALANAGPASDRSPYLDLSSAIVQCLP